MNSKLAALATLAVGQLLSVNAFGGDIDLSKATMQCFVNKSESLFIFQDQEQVVDARFMKEPVALALTSFEVYRCPYCYEFTGTVQGKKYEGSTRGHFNQDDNWIISMSLKINDVQLPSIGCTAN